MSQEDINNIRDKVNKILNEEFLASKDYVPKRRDWLSAYWSGFKSPEQLSRVRNTGYGKFYYVILLPHVLYFRTEIYTLINCAELNQRY